MRGFAYRWLVAAALALAGLMIPGAPASADELVTFTSAGRPDPIQGYLTKPKGAGPFPAVVLLHTCLGLPANRRSIGDSLAEVVVTARSRGETLPAGAAFVAVIGLFVAFALPALR